jgi:hypothetical protein
MQLAKPQIPTSLLLTLDFDEKNGALAVATAHAPPVNLHTKLRYKVTRDEARALAVALTGSDHVEARDLGRARRGRPRQSAEPCKPGFVARATGLRSQIPRARHDRRAALFDARSQSCSGRKAEDRCTLVGFVSCDLSSHRHLPRLLADPAHRPTNLGCGPTTPSLWTWQ